MRERIGCFVARDEVLAVLVRGSEIVWHARTDRERDESFGGAALRMLADAPKRSRRCIAGVALTGSAGQYKEIVGIPAGAKDKLLARLIQENSAAFFLHAARELRVCAASRRSDGACWAAALDADIARDMVASIVPAFARQAAVMPASWAVAQMLPPGEHACTINGEPLRITTVDRGAITDLRRLASLAPDERCGLPDALRTLEAEAWDFAPALGAALSAHTSLFLWREETLERRRKWSGRLLTAAAALCLILSGAASLAAPGVHAMQVAARANRDVAKDQRGQLEAARTRGELQRVTMELDRVNRFAAERGHVTMLLGALSEALPDSTAILSLRVDSLEGSMSLLTARAPDVLPQLAGIESVIAPRIVGSVSREMAGAASVERIAIRFRLPKRAASAPSAKAVSPVRGPAR